MKKALFILTLTLFATFVIRAQEDNAYQAVPVHFSDTTWYDKGFDFYIGGGLFQGNKFNANYYNGSTLNECNLAYIFDNEYRHKDLMQLISEKYPYVSIDDEVSVPVDNGAAFGDNNYYNWSTHYKTQLMIGLGVRYKIGDGWGLSLSYSFSRLTANAQCLLVTTNDYGNTRKTPSMLMAGKEDRSMIDLSASYLFSQVHPRVKPFVELGAQFNYAKVKSFQAYVLDQDGMPCGDGLTLFNLYRDHGYMPGATAYDDIIYGGAGFGISGSAGLKIVVSRSVSIDPTFYCYMGRLGVYQKKNCPVERLAEGNRFTFNWGVMLRVVMNDFFFSK